MSIDINTLTIRNHVIFGLVMRRKHLAQMCLERILGKKISNIEYIESEKVEEVSAETHGIRMDVYCENEKEVYNIEMQAYRVTDIPKRSRYYQDMIDMLLLDKGEEYDVLKKNIVIFICTFDPFGKGRHIYRFENRCIEETELLLGDETTKIILNTKGTMDDIPHPLKLFLDYIETGNAMDDYTRELENAVADVRSNEKWRDSIMTLEMLKEDVAYDSRLQGLEEGRAEGRAEGKAEGLKQGRAEGMAEGLAEGMAEGLAEGKAAGVSSEKKETALRMFRAGKPMEDIMLATDLTEEELRPMLEA